MFAPPIKVPKARTAVQAPPAPASRPHPFADLTVDSQSLVVEPNRAASRVHGGGFSRIPLFARDPRGGPQGRPSRSHREVAIAKVNDPLEHEADHVAEKAIGMSEPAWPHRCACSGACPQCESGRSTIPRYMRMDGSHPTTTAAPPIVQDVLSSSGHPLDMATRAYFEPRFGHDLGNVRVHSDILAAQSADAVQARAYTVGCDVVFGRRQYAPHTPEGQRLLAHELAHTLQHESTQGLSGSLLLRAPLELNRLSYQQLIARADELFRRAAAAYIKETGSGASVALLRREFTVGVLQGVKNGELVTLVGANNAALDPYLERVVGPGERVVPSVELTAHNLRTDLPKKTGHALAHAEPPLTQAAKVEGLSDSVVASSNLGCADCVAQMAEHSPGVSHANPKVASRGSVTPSGSIARPVTTTAVDIDPAQRYRGGRTPPRDVGRATITTGEITAVEKSAATLAEDIPESVIVDEAAIQGVPAAESPGAGRTPRSTPLTAPESSAEPFWTRQVPRPAPMLEPDLGFLAAAKAGAKAGLKEAFSAGNIAAIAIPETLLRVADIAAARQAIRKIQIKFTKEGFAKGVAAGVAGWSYMDANSNLKNGVTPFRLRDMEDPGGLLPYSRLFQVAQAYENVAVDLGYEFSKAKTQKWRNKMRADGLAELARRGYHYGIEEGPTVKRTYLGNMIVEEEIDPEESGPPRYLFTNDFINKLAWVLHPYTDPEVEKAIR